MELKAINISKGGKERPYIPVNERLKALREEYKGYKLVSDIVNLDDNECTIKASIYNDKNEVVATGIANEKKTDSNVNRSSYVENAETSAWGRALGNLGIGIDTSIATLEDIEKVEFIHDITKCKKQAQEIYTEKANRLGSVEALNKLLGVTQSEAKKIFEQYDALNAFEKKLKAVKND